MMGLKRRGGIPVNNGYYRGDQDGGGRGADEVGAQSEA
jgi:hypothetical protein